MGIGFLDIAKEMLFGGFSSPFNVKYGVYNPEMTSVTPKKVEPQNMATVYTAAKILSQNFSTIPIHISKDGKPYKEHSKYAMLYCRMSPIQNNQAFWQTLEYHRCIYGNAFVSLIDNNEILPPNCLCDYEIKNGKLRYEFNWDMDTRYSQLTGKTGKQWINAEDLLHFKGMSVDGIMGLPPISAINHAMQIMNKATGTITSFYDNYAMSPMSIESKIDTAAAAKVTTEALETFTAKYTGASNAGKPIQLPPNTKLTPLAIHFADAELIETMKFSKDEIYTMYGIPKFMVSDANTVQMDIEQQTKSFTTFTLSPIIGVYKNELEYKLFEAKEIVGGISVDYETEVLIATDITAQANAYSRLVTTGIMTPNEAIIKMGNTPIEGGAGDKHYQQLQYYPMEEGHPTAGGLTGGNPQQQQATPKKEEQKSD